MYFSFSFSKRFGGKFGYRAFTSKFRSHARGAARSIAGLCSVVKEARNTPRSSRYRADNPLGSRATDAAYRAANERRPRFIGDGQFIPTVHRFRPLLILSLSLSRARQDCYENITVETSSCFPGRGGRFSGSPLLVQLASALSRALKRAYHLAGSTTRKTQPR